jgi:hypothetical protein
VLHGDELVTGFHVFSSFMLSTSSSPHVITGILRRLFFDPMHHFS